MADIEVTVKVSLPYKAPIGELEQFVEAARNFGLTHFTWSSYAGDQREPSELTLKAIHG